MISTNKSVVLFMEGGLDSDHGKMGFGLMRYGKYPIVCVVDSKYAGKTVREAVGKPFDIPVLENISAARQKGAEVMVLAMAPSGGRLPGDWVKPIEYALTNGMSLINGMHDDLNRRFGHLLKEANGAIIWDVRKPTFEPDIAAARASELNNKRVLLVGTDMAAGKMTVGLELYKWVQAQGVSTSFVATGQIGITIMGQGIPLDAIKVDQACGAVESMVMKKADSDIVFIEGQGSILHPGSTATLPLMRGSCATHLILCHIAGNEYLRKTKKVRIPNLKEFITLNEALTGVCGSLTQAKCVGVALNTFGMTDEEAKAEIIRVENETGLPTTDVVRHGAESLGRLLLG